MKKSNFKNFLCGFLITIGIIAILLSTTKFWLGATIKSTVNKVGPKVLGVPVSVESVSVDLIGGKVRLNSLEIGNPEGFESTPYLFKMDALSLDIAVNELFKGQTHILDIVIDGPHVWYHKKLTSSNLSTLLDILEEKYPQDDSKKKKKDEPSKKGKPVIIDHLLVKEGTIGIKAGIGGEIPLLEIELKNIGKDGALMPVQIVKLLITSIFKGVFSAVANIGGAAVDTVSDVGKTAVKGVVSVAKGIGSLFSDSSDTNAPPENLTENQAENETENETEETPAEEK